LYLIYSNNIAESQRKLSECLQGYFETTRQIIEGFGAPVSIYADLSCLLSF